MSVIYCFRCDRPSDTDFHTCEEALNPGGESELVCERCAEEIGLAEDEGREDDRGYTLVHDNPYGPCGEVEPEDF